MKSLNVRSLGFAIVLLLAIASGAVAQSKDNTNTATLLPQMQGFERSVNGMLRGMFEGNPFNLLGEARAAYLDGFGVVVSAEVNLYPSTVLGAFMSPQALQQEMKNEREQKPVRLKQLQARLRELLVSQSAALTELGPDDSLALVINLFNPRPQPDVPNQIVIQAKRQVLLNLQAQGKKPTPDELLKVVALRSF